MLYSLGVVHTCAVHLRCAQCALHLCRAPLPATAGAGCPVVLQHEGGTYGRLTVSSPPASAVRTQMPFGKGTPCVRLPYTISPAKAPAFWDFQAENVVELAVVFVHAAWLRTAVHLPHPFGPTATRPHATGCGGGGGGGEGCGGIILPAYSLTYTALLWRPSPSTGREGGGAGGGPDGRLLARRTAAAAAAPAAAAAGACDGPGGRRAGGRGFGAARGHNLHLPQAGERGLGGQGFTCRLIHLLQPTHAQSYSSDTSPYAAGGSDCTVHAPLTSTFGAHVHTHYRPTPTTSRRERTLIPISCPSHPAALMLHHLPLSTQCA